MAKSELSRDQFWTVILSYLGILVFIPYLFIRRRDDFMRFHLRQGLALFVIEVILWVASLIFWGAADALISILELCVVVAALYALYQGMFKSRCWKVPYLAPLTERMRV